MTRRKKIIIISAIIIVVVVSVFVFRGRGEQVERETEEATRKDVKQTVSVTGELSSEDEISLNFETAGRIQSIDVAVGDKVAQGEVIATVNDEVLSEEYTKSEAALNKALADAGVNDDSIREAEEAVDDADDYYDMTGELEDQKVAAADSTYDDASNYYDDALAYYNKEVSDHGASSPEALSAKLTLTTALNSKNSADEAKSTARKTRELNLRSAKNSKNSAKEKLTSAKSDYLKNSKDSAVESARAAYNIAQSNLEKAKLLAPANGVITELTYKKGEVLGSASFDLASSASTAFAKMISSDFILESDVPESDITKVKLGQEAAVTFDAFDESEVFVAEVIEVEPASRVIQDVVYYRVKLRLADFDARLKAGMSADIDIDTAQKQNVIAIPGRAIKDQDGEKVVEILEGDGQVKTVQVQIGLRGDEGVVEITSGLSGGEKVVTFTKNGKK